eukprot:scaffold105380_cov74-Phaeocystis_antarctica.AAC.3
MVVTKKCHAHYFRDRAGGAPRLTARGARAARARAAPSASPETRERGRRHRHTRQRQRPISRRSESGGRGLIL